MCRTFRRLLAVVAFLVAGVAFVGGSQAQNPADIAAARELFQQGAKLSKEGRWEEAIGLFVRSLALKPSSLTVYSLAVAQSQTGRLAEALENFRSFVAAPSDSATAPFERPAREAIADLEQRVAHISIRVEPEDCPGLTVYVDGAPVPSAALGLRRLVNPGSHEIKATADGFEEKSASVTVVSGESSDVVLALVPTTTRQPGQADAATGERPSGEHKAGADDGAGSGTTAKAVTEGPALTLPVTLLAGGAALLGVGLAVGLTAVDAASDAPTSDGADADAARGQAIAGDVLAAVGIAATGVGLVWLLVELASSDEAPARAALVTRGRTGQRRAAFTVAF